MASQAPWFRVNIDVFDHPMFEGEIFSKREAWLWLIASATRKKKTLSIQGERIALQVGELLAAREFLAKRWGWTGSKVRAFLARLEREGNAVIRPLGRRKPAVLTICKYEEYQFSAPKERQASAEGAPYYNNTIQKKDMRDCVPEPEQASLPIDEPVAEVTQKTEPKVQKTSQEVRAAFDAYNALASRCGLPSATTLSAARAKKIGARLKDYGLDGWNRALANIELSAFLRGQTHHGFRADLNFVCSEKFERLHDGGYGNGAHAKVAPVGKLSVDKMPPTRDEIEIARRFDLMMAESASFSELVDINGRDVVYQNFRSAQLKKAGVFGGVLEHA